MPFEEEVVTKVGEVLLRAILLVSLLRLFYNKLNEAAGYTAHSVQ
jgi:hypothetical protein